MIIPDIIGNLVRLRSLFLKKIFEPQFDEESPSLELVIWFLHTLIDSNLSFDSPMLLEYLMLTWKACKESNDNKKLLICKVLIRILHSQKIDFNAFHLSEFIEEMYKQKEKEGNGPYSTYFQTLMELICTFEKNEHLDPPSDSEALISNSRICMIKYAHG